MAPNRRSPAVGDVSSAGGLPDILLGGGLPGMLVDGLPDMLLGGGLPGMICGLPGMLVDGLPDMLLGGGLPAAPASGSIAARSSAGRRPFLAVRAAGGLCVADCVTNERRRLRDVDVDAAVGELPFVLASESFATSGSTSWAGTNVQIPMVGTVLAAEIRSRARVAHTLPSSLLMQLNAATSCSLGVGTLSSTDAAAP